MAINRAGHLTICDRSGNFFIKHLICYFIGMNIIGGMDMFCEKKPWLSDKVTCSCKKKATQKVTKKIQRPAGGQGDRKEERISPEQWDKIGLKEILRGKHQSLFSGKSKFQDIEVVQAKDTRMYLNEQLQFSSLDERIYHEAFVHIPMSLTKRHKRVLILGGGDGLALREVVKYTDVEHIDLVDLDKQVLYIAQNLPEMVTLNDHAFKDRRVHAYAQDALLFIQNINAPYDLIIIDFPDPETDVLAKLYSKETFTQIYYALSEDGMVVCQSNCTDETPVVFWSIGRTMGAANFYTDSYHTIIPSFGDWGFHLGAKKPFSRETIKISAPNRTLPKSPASLFTFSDFCHRHKRYAAINRNDNLCLHEIYKSEVAYEF